MLIDEKQQTFIQMRVLDGKSLTEISKAIDVPVHLLKEWSVTLLEHLEEARLNEIDRINSDAGNDFIRHYRYLAEIYKRLKKELDTRDFSGLPTDKLYNIFNDVQSRMKAHVRVEEDWDDYLDEDMDMYDDFDDFDD